MNREPILPGATLGMLGGGQLGRMSMLAGRAMGYRFRVLEPEPNCCAAVVADTHVTAQYDDDLALTCFREGLAAATLEFENVPAQTLHRLAELGLSVYPGVNVLETCQNRLREKLFLRQNGFPCAKFAPASTADELKAAVFKIGLPCVVKSAGFGYDGKGQHKLTEEPGDWECLWESLDAEGVVVEAWVAFEAEASVIVACNGHDFVPYPLVENIHRKHILHMTVAPARLPEKVEKEAQELACSIAEALDCRGLLAVELFINGDDSIVVNELAPRPHNSGHWTIEGCTTSQFEQHVRAVCGLPLGAVDVVRPSVMVNLLGDVWLRNPEPDWSALLAKPGLSLHLYDKGQPSHGRKMGHFTVTAASAGEALALAEKTFAMLN